MQNEYKETIRKMILANENLREKILNDWEIDEENNKIINIELFFLTFSLFPDYYKRIDLHESWKEIFAKGDYYIQGDKIISGDIEISFELLEMTFIETLLKYREKKSARVIQFEPSKKIQESDNNPSSIYSCDGSYIQPIPFTSYLEPNKEDDADKKAISVLETYKLDFDGVASRYLYELKDDFRSTAYESIVLLYNKLKKKRKNKAFKSNLPLLNDDDKNNRYYREFAYMLLSFYPLQFFARDKDVIDYGTLLMPNIEADANHYRFDDTWEEFEKKYEELNKMINNCMIFIRSRKVKETEKRRVRFKINQLEWQKQNLEYKYMCEMVFNSDMREVVEDEDSEESFYTSSVLNKHILYNMENALRNGHVRFEDDRLIFYSVFGDDVDFILSIDNDKMMDIFDVDNLMKALDRNNKERTLNNN